MDNSPSETLIDEITTLTKISVKKFLQKYSRQQQTEEEFVLLTYEDTKVTRFRSNDIMEIDQKYLLVNQKFWRTAVKFLTRGKKERYERGSYDIKEILLNQTLQKIAKAKKDRGDSDMFDLYTDFLRLSTPPKSPFGLQKKKIEKQFQICKIGLQILSLFFRSASAKELKEVAKNAHAIRSSPPHAPRTEGMCLVGSCAILLCEGILIGLSLIFPICL